MGFIFRSRLFAGKRVQQFPRVACRYRDVFEGFAV